MDPAVPKTPPQNERVHRTQRGLTRLHVMARESDRELIHALARRLVEEGQGAEEVRAAIRTAVAGDGGETGRILAALRRSPLVGAQVDFSRQRDNGREIDL